MIANFLPRKWLEDVLSGLSAIHNVHIVLLSSQGRVIYQKPPKGLNGFSFDDVCFKVEDGERISVVTNPYPFYEWSTIVIRGDVVGFVFSFFYSDENRLKAKLLVDLMGSLISDKIFSEFQRKEVERALSDKEQEVELIHNIVDAVSGIFDEKEICSIILEKATEFIKVDRASIMLLDEEKNELYVVAGKGLPKDAIGSRRSVGDGISGTVFKTKKPMLVQDVVELKAKGLTGGKRLYKTKSFVSIPIIVKPPKGGEKVLGVINLTDKLSGEIFTSDDLRLLVTLSHFAGLSIYNALLVKKLREKERLEKELEIARVIQQSLFPDETPRFEGLDVYGVCYPAYEVGGDYYDFFPTSKDTFDFVIADVSGHGVGSSLVMVMLRTLVRSLSGKDMEVSEIVSAINQALFKELDRSGLFITLFYGRFDRKTSSIKYVRAGHNPPILVRGGSGTEFLKEGDIILGMFENVNFREFETRFESNDLLILYTDGLVDTGIEGEGSVERLVDVVKGISQNGVGVRTVVEELIARFCSRDLRKEYLKDDVTVVGLKRV